MIKQSLFITFALFIMSSIISCSSFNTNTIPDWDLSYKTIIDKNNKYDSWLWHWLGHYTTGRKNPDNYISPISNQLTDFKKGRILSSFLIEGGFFHAEEHISIWGVETVNAKYLYVYGENSPNPILIELTPDQYFTIINKLEKWPIKQPRIHEEFSWDVGGSPGFFAFVSIFYNNASRQFKITYDEYLGTGEFAKEIIMPLMKYFE